MLRFIRRRSPLALLAWGLGLAGCPAPEQSSAQTNAASEEPTQVTTVLVREAPMPVTIKLTGTLQPERKARLASSTAGRVTKVHVERGALVKAGDTLAELDVSSAALSAKEAQKAAQNAKVQRENALRECERAEVLWKNGAISKSELELRKLQCESADIGVDAAGLRAQLGAQAVRDGVVRAPFSGVIEERTIDVGEYLMPGSPVATLLAIEKLRLDVVVPEVELPHLSLGAKLSFEVASQPSKRFSAEVLLVGASVREGTRDVVVEATVDNADRQLKPGMFATVEVVTKEVPTKVVPRSAIVRRGEASHLFVFVDGRAHERVVKLGAERGADVAVLRGVSPGDKVIAPPPERLQNGAFVREGG